MTPQELLNKIDAMLPDIRELRHTLHRIPEIAAAEFKTAAFLREKLRPYQLEFREPLLGTDVVADLDTGRPGKTILLRADIDALPLDESTGAPYASEHPGMAHACGHDGHMAMLLGAVRLLDGIRDQLNGRIRFVFQPGEEVRALGGEMVAKGLLKNPDVEFCAALHGWPGVPEGVIETRPGPIMAAAGHFKVKIFGKGGHGSSPELTIDPLLTACEAVMMLQSIVSRRLDPQAASVLGVCQLSAGQSSNVIPDTAEFAGTTRALDRVTAARFEPEMRRILEHVTAANGASYEMDYDQAYEVTVNDPAAVETAKLAVTRYLGADAYRELPRPAMGAEDFGYYLAEVPGVYARLGMGVDAVGLHNPRYDFNDRALRHGIAFFAALALELNGR
ncbi:MAG: M20 family metallopeptidase [Victivallaceae bacterium]